VAIPHLRRPGLFVPELVIVRLRNALPLETGASGPRAISAAFFLVSPDTDTSRHLRLLAHLALRAEEPEFMTAWLIARDPARLRELLLENERSLACDLRRGAAAEAWIDRTLAELELPEGCLVATVRRGNRSIVPRGNTRLRENDRVVLIGDVGTIRTLRRWAIGSPTGPRRLGQHS
jgi:hypothetical protein